VRSPDPAVTALGALAAYNLVQNLALGERAYVPANLGMTVGLVALARGADIPYREMGLGVDELASGMRLGGVVAAGVGVGFAVVSRLGRFDGWLRDERAGGHGAAGAAYRAAIRFPVGTALFEEVAFRSVLAGLWRRKSGARRARVVTAAAFGAWHLLPTYRLYPGMGFGSGREAGRGERMRAALGGALLTAVSSFGFSWLRDRSGSVAAPWLVHAAYNTGGYLAARRAWSRSEG
jgi:membrane protease YdiL (CAAX protease family)